MGKTSKKSQPEEKGSQFNRSLILTLVIIVLISCVYFALRLGPLLAHSVAYTYDQGRDMIKAAEIVLYKNPTFIGPTTGIMGLFHGAWWYYYLTIPFILFGGEPIGFYYANIAIHFASLVILFFVLKKHLNLWVATSISLLTAISPYFIGTSLFIGNNIMTLPAMLAFVITHFIMLEKRPESKKAQWILFALMGISLGLIAEFEFAFGLMIIPVYVVLLFALPSMRKPYFSQWNFLFAFAGLAFAFLPRLLFELKNNFAQTRTLLSFFIEPKLYNPKAYADIFNDRLGLIVGFYKSIFPNETLMVLITLLACGILVVTWIKMKKIQYQSSLVFLSLLVVGLFLFSTVYKDNFWPNYYEGFPYLYVMILAIIFGQSAIRSKKLKKPDFAIYSVMICIVGSVISPVTHSMTTSVQKEGLAVQEEVVGSIISQVGPDTPYCLRIYTPPVITHTYDYLFSYEQRKGNITEKQTDFVDGACYYIIERDDYPERRQAWLDANLPQKGTMTQEEKYRDVVVQLWEVSNDN